MPCVFSHFFKRKSEKDFSSILSCYCIPLSLTPYFTVRLDLRIRESKAVVVRYTAFSHAWRAPLLRGRPYYTLGIENSCMLHALGAAVGYPLALPRTLTYLVSLTTFVYRGRRGGARWVPSDDRGNDLGEGGGAQACLLISTPRPPKIWVAWRMHTCMSRTDTNEGRDE